MCSKAQWCEFGEKSKYLYNLEKRTDKKKHINSLRKEDGSILREPKQILKEEENFNKEIYRSKRSDNFKSFFIQTV